MLRQSDIQKPATAPAPAPGITPALPAQMPDPMPHPAHLAHLASMQQAMGQLAGTMEKLAWRLAAAKSEAPVVAMEADVLRDDDGRMKALRVTIIRRE